MIQLVTKVDEETARDIDRLVDAGRFRSRSDVVRSSLDALLDRERRNAVGEQILAGYESFPETDDEVARAAAATAAMIAEEPW